MEKERNEKGSKFHDRQLLAVLGPLLSSVRADGRPDPHGFNIVQLIQLTTDVTANERAAEKWRRITSEGEALSAVGGEGGQEKEILDDNLYPVSIGFVRDICSIAIHGLGAGLFTPLAPVYVGQISDPRSRSVLLRLIDVAVAFATSNRQPPPHAYLHWRIIVRVSPATLLERTPCGRWIDRGNGSTFEDGNRGWTGCSPDIPQPDCRALLSKYFLYSSWIELGHAPSWNRSRSTTLDRARAQIDQETCHLITKDDFDLQTRAPCPLYSYLFALRLTLVMLEGYLFGSSVSWILSGESFSGDLEKFRDQGTGSLYNLQSVGDSRSLGPTGTTRLCRG